MSMGNLVTRSSKRPRNPRIKRASKGKLGHQVFEAAQATKNLASDDEGNWSPTIQRDPRILNPSKLVRNKLFTHSQKCSRNPSSQKVCEKNLASQVAAGKRNPTTPKTASKSTQESPHQATKKQAAHISRLLFKFNQPGPPV